MIKAGSRQFIQLRSFLAVCAVGVLLVRDAVAGGSRSRIEVRLPSNPDGHDSLIVDYNELKSDFAAVTLKTRGKSHRDTGFFCQKKTREISCVGDDDSGRFTISKDGVRIEFLSLNVAGERVLSYQGSSRSLKFSRKR